MQHPRRRSIGLRVPDHNVALALLSAHGEPLISSTLLLPGDDNPLQDPDDIRDRLEHNVDLIIHGGYGDIEQTTVLDMTGDTVELIREGKGDFSAYL